MHINFKIINYFVNLKDKKYTVPVLYEIALSPSTETVYKLNPSLKKKGTFDPKWNLYINEVF
jgi:hypothetical protein